MALASRDLRFDHIGLHVGSLTAGQALLGCGGLQLEELGATEASDTTLLDMKEAAGPLQVWRLRFPQTAAEVRLIEDPDAPTVDADHANPGTCHLCFYTDDLVRTWAHLEQQGYQLCSDSIVPIKGGVFDGGKCIYFIGPDGIRIELLEGLAYLDGNRRLSARTRSAARANEASHIGLHVRDRDRSLTFYRDLLGFEVVASWLEHTPSTRRVIGYPTAELFMSILRLPGTQSFFEVIEYRGVPGKPVDNSLRSNGVCHLGFRVSSLAFWRHRLTLRGFEYAQEKDCASLWCVDPDGYRVMFTQDAPPSK